MPKYRKSNKVCWKMILNLCERQINLSIQELEHLKSFRQNGFLLSIQTENLKQEIESYYDLRNFLGYRYFKRLDKEFFELYQKYGWEWNYIKKKDFS